MKQVKVLGSTAFSQKELEAVTDRFIGKEINLDNAYAIRSAITQLYVDNGYTTSAAFLSNEQDVSDGVIKIQVIEGQLEELHIQGLSHLNESYVQSRLATETPININKLQESLQLLQNDPLIANISANLAVGSGNGLSILTVRVSEADTWTIGAAFNNARSPAVGSDQAIAQLSNSNLIGRGDRADLIYSHTEGSDTFNFSYQVPINSKNGTIRATYATSSNEIVEEPFTPLDIQSESRSYELSYRQPIVQTPTQEFALGITASRIESESSLLGERFPLSRGADDEGRTRISALRFSQEYSYRGVEEVFLARAQISLGVGAFGATINEEEPDSRFFSWQAQAQYVRLLAPDTFFLLRGEFQLADRELLVDEQFRLGGTGSVRGYRQDLLLGDNGLFASAEVRVPILRIPQWETVLQVAPFFDVGKVWSSNGNNSSPSNLASFGLGLLLSGGDNFSAGFYWAVPLVEVDDQGDSLQEEGGSFFVEGRFSF
ncbi:MAG: ShlB/FhaC/HecB family hemolysin secretion/activation protein [Hydrococcus sp. RU_2_2]|nr:ShlB/FhaC/HecB family hemolysin secretion/activation protein [Hydrococcus sp. RU_2_2]